MAGALVFGHSPDRFNPHVVLFGSYTVAAALIVLLGQSTGSASMLAVAAFGAGIGTGGSQIGINALSAAFYPTASRATGVSWSNAIGRSGAVLGAMMGGTVLSLGWSLAAVFAVAAIPALLAGLSILAKGRLRVPAPLTLVPSGSQAD